MGALIVDEKNYGRLLAKALPRVIDSPAEHRRLLAEAEGLMDRGKDRSPEEDALLSLLTSLIDEYEARTYTPRRPSPHEMLRHLMEKRGGLRQADLLDTFHSRGHASDVINGKRSISKAQARKLADFFGVTADLFI